MGEGSRLHWKINGCAESPHTAMGVLVKIKACARQIRLGRRQKHPHQNVYSTVKFVDYMSMRIAWREWCAYSLKSSLSLPRVKRPVIICKRLQLTTIGEMLSAKKACQGITIASSSISRSHSMMQAAALSQCSNDVAAADMMRAKTRIAWGAWRVPKRRRHQFVA